jgi:hypothetical protein
MDVKRAFRTAVGSLLVAGLWISSFAQSERKTYDPAGRTSSSTQRDGFIDFTLKRINPADQNYGKCLDEGRGMLLDESVRNAYFWSNLVALGLLGSLFLIIIYQHRIKTRGEWVTAEMLSQYEEKLIRGETQVQAMTLRNQEFMRALNTYREATLRTATPRNGTSDAAAASRPQRVTNAATKHSSDTGADVERASPVAIADEPAGQIALFHGDGDLIVTINSLKQQLAHAEEEKKLLRRRITNADRQLAAEQHKNRQLKGD